MTTMMRIIPGTDVLRRAQAPFRVTDGSCIESGDSEAAVVFFSVHVGDAVVNESGTTPRVREQERPLLWLIIMQADNDSGW